MNTIYLYFQLIRGYVNHFLFEATVSQMYVGLCKNTSVATGH